MIPVILSGGSGSRLWPVSRSSYPKQFCELLDESLYAKTIKRLKPLGAPWTVTVKDLQVLTEKCLREEAVPSSQTIFEPFGMNTAPAIAVLCRLFELRGWENEVVGIFPADQLVGDDQKFLEAVRTGVGFAEDGNVVTLGVKPTYPATGYGYIETVGPVEGGKNALRATGFREKPNESTARDFISRGGFYWNAGMFIFKVSTMSSLLQKFATDLWKQVQSLGTDLGEIGQIYTSVKSISIDYAVMEKLDSHVCVPCDFSWSDLGSWDAISEIVKMSSGDENNVVTIGSGKNFVFPTSKKTYGLVDVEDLIIVDSPDALLVTKKGSTERVKEVVDALKNRDNISATQHQFEVRPWGRFELLHDNDQFKSKTLTVDPGEQLSYQAHQKRTEHWIIVNGEAEVTLDDRILNVGPGCHVHIPVGTKHRIRNTGTFPLQFVEIQLGEYFGEDDIVRYSDAYGRI